MKSFAAARQLRGRELVEWVLRDHQHHPGFFRSEVLRALHDHMEDSRSALLEAARNAGRPRRRIDAVLFLLRLGDPAFPEGLRLVLEDKDAGLRASVLHSLRQTIEVEQDAASALLSRPEVQAALLLKLEDPDSRVRIAAVEMCGEAGIPGVVERLSSMLAEGDLDVRIAAAVGLSRSGTDQEAFEVIRSLFREQIPGHLAKLVGRLADHPLGLDDLPPVLTMIPHWSALVTGLENYLRGPDQRLSRLAEEVLREHYLATPISMIPFRNLCVFLERCRPESISVIDKLVELPWFFSARHECLSTLARLRGKEARGRIRESLEHPEAVGAAAEALAILEVGSGDRELTSELLRMAETCPLPGLRRVLKAVLAIGGPEVRQSTLDILERRESGLWLDVFGELEGHDLESVLRDAVERGIIERLPDSEAIRKARDRFREEPSTTSLLEHFLAREGVLVLGPPGTDELPRFHDELLERFAEHSRGLFVLDDVVGEGLAVRFRARGQEYSTDGEPQEAERGVSVVKAVNRALTDAALPERFVGLGQGRYLFGAPEKVRAFAANHRIPVEEDMAWTSG
jgi:HEAT repeat protein